ncbi:MAG: HypC/HybG/HupF family hydrogenase formation chaperone [Eggerthellaceae bacterium]|nr:HypC/HybG/HupF family hydrogenase formation chaperone [Eggerthellaceae bacterium]
MCLAVPMQILEIKDDGMARVTAMGAERDAALDLTPQATVGDYVLVHAGFAIEVVDQQYAEETLELIQTMADMVDDPLFNELDEKVTL